MVSWFERFDGLKGLMVWGDNSNHQTFQTFQTIKLFP